MEMRSSSFKTIKKDLKGWYVGIADRNIMNRVFIKRELVIPDISYIEILKEIEKDIKSVKIEDTVKIRAFVDDKSKGIKQIQIFTQFKDDVNIDWLSSSIDVFNKTLEDFKE